MAGEDEFHDDNPPPPPPPPEAIKSRFRGNDESKNMHKYILKQQFESFFVSNSKGLHKGYDRFQSLLSQLEIHGASVSTEDANQKFLRVFESDIKGSTGSSTSAQNVAFVSSSTSSTNDVDEFDLEEMDLKWQVAMISMRMKKFYKKTGRKLHFDAKEPVSFDKTKVECFNCHNTRHFSRECQSKGNQEEDEQKNFALMAYSNSGSNTEVTSCSKECEESYAKLKKLYDEQREQLGDASIEIQSYTQALKKMSAKDKSGLGYGDQIHEGILSYENEVLESVFNSRSSDVEDSPVNDGFAKSKTNESTNNTSDSAYCESNSSVETLESVPKPVVNEPKAVSKPKVWSDAPIIEEYESDSDNEYVIKPSKEQQKSSFPFVNTIKHVKTPRETVKKQNTCSPRPKADKRDWNGLMSKKLGLGYGFTKKACFVCGSFSHLLRDCDFHEKRMAKQDDPQKALERKKDL
ncbi:hypothetical protein Tco_0702730 [Tanacetum coccineum]|uniref:CCHC-type domain-containing protein n=1 Tax=Tanacetum coccineum TaxID=301880 RepID=A0ABQ4XWV2_9ASTR